MIIFNFDIFLRILGDLVAELKSTNLKFVVRTKPELPSLVESILQNYKHGIHATSQNYRQAHNLNKKLWLKDPLLIHELSSFEGAFSVHFQSKV